MAVCGEHSGVCVQMENIKQQTEGNTRDIKTLSDAVIKLTILVEESTKRSEVAATDAPRRFWDTDTKKYALRLLFILSIVIILALIGTNIIETTNLDKLIR